MADTNNEATSPAPAALIVHGIPVGVPVPVDAELDPDSSNPVSNKAASEKLNKIDARFNGNTVATWMDIPESESVSGKKTRVFIPDNDPFIGMQISSGDTLEKGARLRMIPTATPITFINGVTTSEQVNCNFVDFGIFFVVNLAGVVVPAGGGIIMCQLPAFSRCRINVTLPSGIIIYIDANTRELKATGAASGCYASLIVPVYDARY